MTRILESLRQHWPKYLLELLVIAMGIFGALVLKDWHEGRGSNAQEPSANVEGLPDPLEAGWQGVKVCEVLVENDKIRMLKCVFPPNVGHEQHYHPPHTGYTLVGGKFRITDSTGTREVNVPTGYAFGNEQVSVHEVLNVGETTAEFLIIEPKK